MLTFLAFDVFNALNAQFQSNSFIESRLSTTLRRNNIFTVFLRSFLWAWFSQEKHLKVNVALFVSWTFLKSHRQSWHCHSTLKYGQLAHFESCARCVPGFLSYAKRIGLSSGIADSLLTSLTVEKYKWRVALHFLRLLDPADKAWRLVGPSPAQIRSKERAPVEEAARLSKWLPDTAILLIKCKNLWFDLSF